jgi:hypothetical protein
MLHPVVLVHTIISSGMGNSNSQMKVKVTHAQLCHNERDPILIAKGYKFRDKPSLNLASFVGSIRQILGSEGQHI